MYLQLLMFFNGKTHTPSAKQHMARKQTND